MNWIKIMKDLNSRLTLQQIADKCGLASKGHAHDILAGRQKTVIYEVGARLIELHKREMSKASREAKMHTRNFANL